MKRVLIAVLISVAGLTALAILSAPRVPVTKSPALHPVAASAASYPDPFAGTACVFPDVAYLAAIAGESDLVVTGTVEGVPQVVTYTGINQNFTRYALRVRSVLRGTTDTGILTVEEVGGVVRPILKPGPQVVFLHAIDSTKYVAVEGLNGIFLTRASGMTRECPHGPNPSVFVSDGSSEAAFSAEIEGLTPTRPPHH